MSSGQVRSTIASTSAFRLDTPPPPPTEVKKTSSRQQKRTTKRTSRIVLDEAYRRKLIKRQEESPIYAQVQAYEAKLNREYAARQKATDKKKKKKKQDATAATKSKAKAKATSATRSQSVLPSAETETQKPTTTIPNPQQSTLRDLPVASSAFQQRDVVSTPAALAATTDSSQVVISRNLPLQLVIIIGAIVLFAMFVASLAWLCRASSRKEKKALGKRNRKNTWSPGGPSSIYTDSSSNQSNSSLTMSKNVKSRTGQSALSPISPMPLLKDEKSGDVDYLNSVLLMDDTGLKVPRAVATNQLPNRSRGSGWQLFDNPVPKLSGGNDNGDIESAGLPPARRPSFIDRLLAHRVDLNDARLPSQLGVDSSLMSPNVESNLGTSRGARKVSGSALLSALSVSLPAWPNALRSKENNQQRLAPLESDFEGTIGGRDGEIPMAKRVRKSQGRFACDASTEVPTPQMQRFSIDHFSPLPNRLSALQHGTVTPHTPGLAGVGSLWMGGVSGLSPLPPTAKRQGGDTGGRPPTFAELQRQPVSHAEANRWSFQSTIDRWVIGSSQYATRPPPPSRKGSTNSFLTNGGTPQSRSAKQTPNEASGLERMVSIRPHFAPTTTLASWLIQDDQDHSGMASGQEAESIIEKYLVDGEESQISDDTDFDRKRGMLWEEVAEPLPPSYRSPISTKPLDVKSKDIHRKRSQEEDVAWGQEEEQLEEEKRQIDRRQKMLLKEQRKQHRRWVRQQQRLDQVKQMEEDAANLSERARQQAMMHFVLEMNPSDGHDMVEMQEEEEEEAEKVKLRLRLEPSFNDFNAPVFLSQGDLIVAQSRRHSNSSKIILPNRAPVRAISLSPPESPLTSASEGPIRNRRAPGNFLVASSRSRSSGSGSSRSGSRQSVSHGTLLSMIESPDPARLASLVESKQLPRKHSRHHHRSASEKQPSFVAL